MSGLAVLDRGPDSSGLHLGESMADLRKLKRSGGSFFLRYSAGAASSPSHPSYDAVKWKLCGRDEIRNGEKLGVDFVAIDEWYASRIEEGAEAGAEDGAAVLRFWRARGYRKGGVIIPPWDTAPSRSNYSRVAAYLREYAEALEGYYCVGLYAGDPVLEDMFDRGLIVVGWLPMAMSWSRPGGGWNKHYQPGDDWQKSAKTLIRQSRAHLLQNGNRWFDGQADENVVLRAGIPSHLSTVEVEPPKVKKPTPAKPTPAKPTPRRKARPGRSYTVRPSDSDGLIAVCRRHGVKDWRAVARLNGIKGPKYVVHPGDVIRWPGGRKPHTKHSKPATGGTYTIRASDSDGLIAVCARHGIADWRAVARLNGIKGPDYVIRRGQTIRWPGDRPRKTTVKVQPGDTITKIARRWGVTPKAVMRANPHAGHPAGDFDVIWPGDVLVHP